MKIRLLVKKTVNGDHFWLKVAKDQVKTKKVCLGYFCRFMRGTLKLRPPKKYFYVFQVLFSFRQLSATSCGFLKLGKNSFSSTLYFQKIE